MKTENIYCDFCECLCVENKKKIKSLNGFKVELAYSVGGWGSANHFTPTKEVEICDDCFEKVKRKSKEMDLLIKSLKK